MRPSLGAGACAFVLCLFRVWRARADPAPVVETIPSEPIEVTVRGTRGGDAFASTRAATTTVVEEVRASHAGSIADALRGQTGVSVQQTTPGQGTIYVRGLSGRGVVHLVDGVRLNSAIFRAGNNPYLGLVDPYAMTQIEVIRGASSDIHGSDALGGVVTMATVLPSYRAGRGETLRELGVIQTFTTNALGSYSRVDGVYADSDRALHVGVSYRRDGDIRPGEGQTVPDASSFIGLERQAGAAYRPAEAREQVGTSYDMLWVDMAGRHRLGPRTEAVLRSQLAYRPSMTRVDEINPLFKRAYPQRSVSELAPLGRGLLASTLIYRPEYGIDRMLVMIAWHGLAETLKRRDMDEDCLTSLPSESGEECAGGRRLRPATSLATEHNRSDTLTARAEVQAGRADHAVGGVVGVEVVHDIVTSSAREYDYASATSTDDASRYPDGATMTQAGLFGRLETRVGRRVRVHVGTRLSGFSVGLGASQAASAGTSFHAFDATVTSGASLELTPGVRLVANFGRGVRAPNVDDFAGIGARANGRVKVPNADLASEHSLSVDGGLKARLRGLATELYVFGVTHEDAIVLAPTERRAPDGASIVRSENAARIDYVGTEGQLSIDVVRARLGLFARWLALIGKQKNSGATAPPAETPADRVPPAQVALGVWGMILNELRTEILVLARAPQRRLNDPINLDDSRIPVGGTPGSVTANLRARYRPSPATAVRLTLDNIADTLVLEHGSGYYRPGFGATLSLETVWR